MYAAPMSKGEVDKYLLSLEQPKRGTLEALRQTILDIIPEAEQCISYGMPAFRVQGKVIAGFAAFKNHLSYRPTAGPLFLSLGTHFPITRLRKEPSSSQSIGRYPHRRSRAARHRLAAAPSGVRSR